MHVVAFLLPSGLWVPCFSRMEKPVGLPCRPEVYDIVFFHGMFVCFLFQLIHHVTAFLYHLPKYGSDFFAHVSMSPCGSTGQTSLRISAWSIVVIQAVISDSTQMFGYSRASWRCPLAFADFRMADMSLEIAKSSSRSFRRFVHGHARYKVL